MKLIRFSVLSLVSHATAALSSKSHEARHHASSLIARGSDASRLDKIQQMYAFEGFVYALDVSWQPFHYIEGA